MIRLTRAALAALAFLTLALQAAVAPRQPVRQSAGEVLAWGRAQGNQPMMVSHLGQVKAIAQGGTHSLALTKDGKIWAWGFNNFGQLGDGSNTNRDVPVLVANMANAVAIAAGDSHSLALTSDGKVWAWGVKEELGNAAIADSNLPVPVNGLSGVVSIAASGVHSLALTADGKVWAWGLAGFGELGNGSLGPSNVPVLVANLTGVVTIAAGKLQSLAVTDDGRVWAWGMVGDQVSSAVPTQVSGLNGVIAIAAGYLHNVALTGDGKVWAWGENDSGQLGNGGLVKSYTPVLVSNLSGVIAIACGDRHNLALTSDGKVWTWGAAGSSQLVPVPIDNLDGVASIAAGGDNSLVLGGKATSNAWGLNQSGQLGNETQTNSNVPLSVMNLNGIVAEAAGAIHSLALTADGKVWAWGRNYAGALGNGTYADSSIPMEVSNLSGVKAVAAGANHNLALTSDGRVWSWGLNLTGQLGNGTFNDSNVPVPVSLGGTVVAIAAGANKSLALTSDGRVWAWGDNPFGELGNGTYASSAVPVLVSNLRGVTSIAAGFYWSLALTSDGRVWSWGDNRFGSLGIGSNSGSPVPVMLNNLNSVIAIVGGANHNFALTSDGKLWGWGYNADGELGDGTNVSRNVPVQVKNISGIVGFVSGGYHSLAVDAAGEVWAWGSNQFGQLGTGNDATSNVPAQISMHNALAVAAGDEHSLEIGIAAEDGLQTSASFQGIDSTTQGNWKGHYGADGYVIAGDLNVTPGYAGLIIGGANPWTWATATTDPRALLRGASPTDRIASTYYSASSFTFDVNTTGGPHRVALYLLDLDNAGRSETISIIDPATNNVLDTRSFSNFRNGVYVSWMVQGHVVIKVANNGGLNAVVSGLFFGNAPPVGVPAPVVSVTSPTSGNVSGTITLAANATSSAGIASVQFQMNGTNVGTISGAGPVFSTTFNTATFSNGSYSVVAIATDNLGQHTTSSAVAVTISNGGATGTPAATFVKFDTTTGGTWTGVYGQNGFEIANNPGTWPIYGGVATDNAKTWTWAASTTDPRALQQGVSSTARIASAYYSSTSFTLDLGFYDAQAHRVALYCLDMDSDERSETISILDPVTHAVLDSRNVSHFHNGVYIVWNLQGRVLIQVTSTGGLNAVVSGVFFGDGSTATTPPPTVSLVSPSAGPVSGVVSLSAHATSLAGIVSTSFVLDNTIILTGPYPGPNAFTDIDFLSSWYSATAANGPHTLTAIATDPLGQSGSATININVNNAAPSASFATFVGQDTTTLGNWKGHYGQDGQIIANDANNLPTYATAAWTGASQFSWSLTQDPRALQQAAGSARTASTFYMSNSSGNFSLDLNLTDGKAHQVALYFLDWDHSNRWEEVSIFEAGTQNRLDGRSISDFEQGAYLVWNVSGHVTIQFQSGNGVVSGVFLGPPQ